MPETFGFGGSYLTWYGKEVEFLTVEVTKRIVENIVRYAANHARANHPLWENDTGATEASVFHGRAEVEGFVVRALWGASSADPEGRESAAKYLEFGTVKMAARPWLRPAADAAYRISHFAGALGRGFGPIGPG